MQSVSAVVPGQVLLESTVWVFLSRGKSRQLLRLLLIISPIIVGSFLIGLSFDIKGVDRSGSLVLVGMLPWVLKYTFRATNLTLQRLGQPILYPISLSVAGVVLAELTLHLTAPQPLVWQLLVAALGFATIYLLSTLIPSVRSEIMSLRESLGELSLSRQTA